MPLLNEIKSLVLKKEAKYAFIDIACLLLLADNKSTLAEQDWIDNLLALDGDGMLLEEHYDNTMAKVKGKSFDSVTMIESIVRSLNSKELRALAKRFVDEFVATSGAGSSPAAQKENALAIKIRHALSK
jgi:hypothetical protein